MYCRCVACKMKSFPPVLHTSQLLFLSSFLLSTLSNITIKKMKSAIYVFTCFTLHMLPTLNTFSSHSIHSQRVMHMSYSSDSVHAKMVLMYWEICCIWPGHTWVWHVYDPLGMAGIRWLCVFGIINSKI